MENVHSAKSSNRKRGVCQNHLLSPRNTAESFMASPLQLKMLPKFVCGLQRVDGKFLSPKCKVGRGRNDWFTSKVFGDGQDTVCASDFVVEIAKSCVCRVGH